LGKRPDPAPVEAPAREGWFLAHPYPMPPHFTGRVDERAMLTGWIRGGAQNAAISGWLNGDPAHPMLVLRALGGFGKSALAWQWLNHDVDPEGWPRAVWWSFYEGDASFDAFVSETLKYVSRGNQDPGKLGPRQQVDALLDLLRRSGILLVLDGFERMLRAFGGIGAAYQGDEVPHDEAADRECLCPLAETFLRAVVTLPGLKSKVLLTTRLRPHAVETRDGQLLAGCREGGEVGGEGNAGQFAPEVGGITLAVLRVMEDRIDIVEDVPLGEGGGRVATAELFQCPIGDVLVAVAAVFSVGVEGEALGASLGKNIWNVFQHERVGWHLRSDL